MMSKIPGDLEKSKRDINKEVLRVAMIAELDAVNLYEQLAAVAGTDDIKKVFLDIAKEEKTHAGEFQEMLLREDAEQARELEKGKEEIKKLIGGKG